MRRQESRAAPSKVSKDLALIDTLRSVGTLIDNYNNSRLT
jgi:hypothetical protein